MAATKGKLTKTQQDQVREAIRTTQLVKRLQWFALAENDDQDARVEIDPQRLKAIEILLKKSLPDLSAVQVDATVDVADPLAELLRQVAQSGKRIGV